MAVTTVRSKALLTSTSFAQAGVVYNDSVRLLEGGLWQTAMPLGNQPTTISEYTADIKTVTADLAADVAKGLFTGAALTTVQAIQAELPTLLKAASASVNGGGTFGSVTAAEKVLHTTALNVLTQVNGNTKLAALAVSGTHTGFGAAPVGLAAGVTANSAAHANLAEIGVIFNSADDIAIGGLNNSNLPQFNTDLKAVYTDLKQLIANDPALFGDGLHLIHAETILNQVSLQVNDFDNQYGVNVVAGRATNDNLLDILDIVNGDSVLFNNAHQGGVNGFSAVEAYLSGSVVRYQDNTSQTNFWAKFIVGANTLTAKANAAVTSGNQTLINTVIAEIQAYQKFGANYDASQGGIFGARFDNELLSGTLLEDSNAAIQGLKSGNAVLVAAAGSGFIADAKDVSGNNVPVTGGKYNGNATTITKALSMAHATTTATTGTTTTTTTTTGTTTTTTGAAGTGTGTTTTAGNGTAAAGTPPAHHHHEHIWHHM